MTEHALQSVAFPTLDEAQISEFGRCTTATSKVYRHGQTLMAVGDRDFKFFIVKSGEVEIVDHSAVRSGSVKRVASAVGEGSMVVQFVHEFLEEM